MWTPDSTSVALGSNRSGTFKLYRQSITQSVPDLLVDTEDTLQARAAPDGEHLIYMVGGNPDNLERKVSVMSVPVQGGSPRLLFSESGIVDIQCARTSPLSLYSTQRLMPNAPAYAKVFSFDPKDGTHHEFPLPHISDFQEWSLSPDGSTLATIVNGPKLRFVNMADKSVRETKLTGNWTQLIAIDWAADGKSVYIPSRKPDGNYVVLRVTPAGTLVVLEGARLHVISGLFLLRTDSMSPFRASPVKATSGCSRIIESEQKNAVSACGAPTPTEFDAELSTR